MFHKPILVGLSGGPDSLCLLDWLQHLGYELLVAHLDHGLRPESRAEATQVMQAALKRGLRFFSRRVETQKYAAQRGLSVEEAARELRYTYLFSIASEQSAQAVAVGHSADDQVETVLMHLLRGAGLAGLRGMEFRTLPNAWSMEIPLVRPLLDTWRQEIMGYCRARGLTPVFDQSNLDVTFFRNRLRHEIIPLLEQANPAFKRNLLRTTVTLQGDYRAIQAEVEQAWQACLSRQGDGFTAFHLEAFLQQLPGIQRHLLRQAIERQRPGLRDIDFEMVEKARQFASQPAQTRQSNLGAGLRVFLEGALLWLAAWEADLPGGDWPSLEQDEPIELPVPGRLELGNGWVLTAEMLAAGKLSQEMALENQDPYQGWLDAAQLQVPLNVRHRRAGDRFVSLGMGEHSTKVSDMMINHKLPRRLRARWPLVCSGEQIVWLPGVQVSHAGRVTPGTTGLVHLSLLKQD